MKFSLQLVEAMAQAHREKGLDRAGLRHLSLEWDEISTTEFLDCIAQMEAALEALCAARPNLAELLHQAARDPAEAA